MDSNVTKNTFLYKFFKIDFANNKLSIKQILQQQILRAIDLYSQHNKIRDSWDSAIVSLPDKLILLNVNKRKIGTEKNFTSSAGFNYWVYRCAIAFPLANYCGIKPLKMAQELVTFFPDVKCEQVTTLHSKIIITIIPPGWIDFKINHDFFGVWWQQLILKLDSNHNYRIEINACHENLHFITTTPNLFAINYYHDRCCSLLKLGEREGLIQLDNHNFESLSWQISKPHPIIWFDVNESFLLVHPQELNLLNYLLLILDDFDDLRGVPLTQQVWLNYALNLCKALEQFMIACRFCGEVKHQNPQLAIARLGLIAVIQWCLFKLMGEKLQVTPIALSEL